MPASFASAVSGVRMTSVVVDGMAGDALVQRAGHRGELGEQRGQAAGVVEVLHQVLPRWPDVGQPRDAAGDGVEVVQGQGDAGAAGDGDQVDQRVRRAAEREHGRRRVLERLAGEDRLRGLVVPDHVDDALAGVDGHPVVGGVDGGDRRGAGQRHAERFGGAGHRGGGAHRHAVARRPGDAFFEVLQVAVGGDAGPVVVPDPPHVGAAADSLPPVVAAEHRARGDEDRRDVRARRAHDEGGRGLVAAAHEHRAVEGVGAEQLFCLHRQQVAVHHRRRLLERLAERGDRHLDREAAGLEDAALDLFGALAQVLVAGVDAGPGVEDGDDRLALVLFRRDPEAAHPGAVAERADAVGAAIAEPAVASELLWGLHAWYRRSQHAVASRVPLAARTLMWGFLQRGRPGLDRATPGARLVWRPVNT